MAMADEDSLEGGVVGPVPKCRRQRLQPQEPEARERVYVANYLAGTVERPLPYSSGGGLLKLIVHFGQQSIGSLMES